MPYSIQLRFDAASELSLLELSQSVESVGLADPHRAHGSLPHLALAVFRDADPDSLVAAANALPIVPFDVHFSSLGTFATSENVIFLAPDPSQSLLRAHQDLYDRLGARVPYDSYYKPGAWLPHCTIGIDFTEPQFSRAFDHFHREFRPLTCRVSAVIVTRFRPSEVLFRREIDGS